ncbi:MAG: PqqD family protein [Clostridia bacterium]|nr:PqqD family protein [Clostridia bacterium]
MKIKAGFIVRQIGENFYAMPITEMSQIGNGMIKLNETAHFMWEKLESGIDAEALADAICSEYSIEREAALKDVKAFCAKLGEAGVLES